MLPLDLEFLAMENWEFHGLGWDNSAGIPQDEIPKGIWGDPNPWIGERIPESLLRPQILLDSGLVLGSSLGFPGIQRDFELQNLGRAQMPTLELGKPQENPKEIWDEGKPLEFPELPARSSSSQSSLGLKLGF